VRRALLAGLGALGVALGFAGPAAGAVRCTSGFTLHEERGVRLFGAYRGDDIGLYACTSRRPRPARIWSVSPATTPELFVHGRTGSRLAISLEEFADGGNGIWVGWFDVRTGRRTFRAVRGPTDRPDPEDDGSDFTPHPDAIGVGRDGSVAYAFAAGGGTYEVFHRLGSARGLARRERRLARLPGADFEPLSLASTNAAATWRTRGEPRSAPLMSGRGVAPSAAPPASLAARVRCDRGDGLYSDDAVRVFATRRGVFGCGRRAVRVAGRGARLVLAARARRVLGFVLRRGSRVLAGSLGLRSGALRVRAVGAPAPEGLAAGADGGVAFTRRESGERSVGYLPPAPARFGPTRALARVPAGELDPATLALTKVAVTWRTVGAPRRAAAP
jgi:hypothetical protein